MRIRGNVGVDNAAIRQCDPAITGRLAVEIKLASELEQTWRTIARLEVEAACYRREILRLLRAEGPVQDLQASADELLNDDETEKG